MRAREIVIVGFPGLQPLDVSGPFEVFAGAQQQLTHTGSKQQGYRVRLVAAQPGPLQGESGLTLLAQDGVEVLHAGRIDTLIVAGGAGVRQAMQDQQLLAGVRAAAVRARRVCSVCTGTFLLAQAGLLDGLRVTTHWASCGELQSRFPALTVDPEPIYVRDGSVYTSAGVTAGIDLALALVQEDLGREVALTVARHLVVFLRRPANQAQFSEQLQAQLAASDPLRELQLWMIDHPSGDLSVEALAQRAAMSVRHFARSFTREAGTTPARYVERVRVEAARRALEDSGLAIEEVARECGFGTAETMRRTFLRALGVAPSEYRRRFAVAR